MTNTNSSYLDIHPEVAHALAHNKPVVALESTIISHGMPYPQNVATALEVEAEVRKHGAVPATIAIIGGRLKAGLTPAEIEVLGTTGRSVTKVSRRDIPFIVAAGATGAALTAALRATFFAETGAASGALEGFFFAAGLAGAAGLSAPCFSRTGLAPQISSRR